ncbi:MAG: hypothetical protein JWP06_951 [Candidatus Saccharibacteria bacterium]|nr:hypothetical protein [Candidatus Saccharibacteria bacterium]
MKKQLVLIKFGGSLISDKEKEDTARPDIIARCAEQVKEVKQALPDADLIIGTGAGSFGHMQALRYMLKKNIEPAEQFYGMCVIHNNVRKLNEMVVDQLTERGIPAFSISPSAFLMASDGAVTSSFLQPLRQLLASGCIPMVHGDVALDSVRGLTIMSTEKILQICLEDLRELYEEIIVIYCMDSDGVWDEDRKTIPVLEKDQLVFTYQSDTKDVTGGIEGKVKSARKAAELADSVYLISGMEQGALKKAMEGNQIGTRVT